MKKIILFACFLFSLKALAESDEGNNGILEFPIVDTPFNNTNHGRFPSMMQSLNITRSLSNATHLGMQKLLDSDHVDNPGTLTRFLIVLADGFVLSTIPGYTAWLHEEWHRAVMSQYGIDSFNGVYDYSGGNTIPVKKVLDEDLIRLKSEHPADQVRLSAAGMEADIYFAEQLNRDDFQYETAAFNQGFKLINVINVIAYLGTCDSGQADRMTDHDNEKEKDDIPSRDFTGLDCTAWVYDLFRANEPYENRGQHPYGQGLNRYIKYSDLSDSERKFLKRTFILSWLNLVDPMFYSHFSFGESLQWNANLKHYMTSFGNVVDLNLMLHHPHGVVFATLHDYFNAERHFPGVTVELVDSPMLQWQGIGFDFSFHLWQQPKDFSVYEKTASLGGMIGSRMNFPIAKSQKIYLETELKSPGWVAGTVQQGQAANARLGYQWVY